MNPNVWYALGEALQGGQRQYQLEKERRRLEERERFAQEMQRRQEARAQQAAMLAAQREGLERQVLQHTLQQQPVEDAALALKRNLELKGPEAVLNDPSTLELAEKAGVRFDRRPTVPRGMLLGADTPFGPISGERIRQVEANKQGVFSETGIVKPPEVLEKEAEREQAIRRAQLVTEFMQRMGTSGKGGGGPFEDTPTGRMMMKLGLGLNANDIWGSVRQTPEEAAAIAKAQAEARLPYQKQLIDAAAAQRGLDAGDPYFNKMVDTLLSLYPPSTPEQAKKVIDQAAQFALEAQAKAPRGKSPTFKPPAQAAPVQPGVNPASAAPSLDATILEAVKRFGGWEEAVRASSAPDVQARLKSLGVDPAQYLRRMQALKIQAKLEGK